MTREEKSVIIAGEIFNAITAESETEMIKGMVFDKDGTLLEYESFWVKVAEIAIAELLERRSCGKKHLRELLDSIGAYDGIAGLLCHGTYASIAQALSDKLAELCPDADKISVGEATEAFERATAGGEITPACKDIRGFFSELKNRGIVTALVTNDNLAMSRMCLRSLGILEYFDAIYTAEGEHPSKPHPYYMQRFCSEFSLSPCEAVMLGDTLTDMSFAKNSGAWGVGVAKKERDKQTLAPHAYAVVEDISCVLSLLDDDGELKNEI